MIIDRHSFHVIVWWPIFGGAFDHEYDGVPTKRATVTPSFFGQSWYRWHARGLRNALRKFQLIWRSVSGTGVQTSNLQGILLSNGSNRRCNKWGSKIRRPLSFTNALKDIFWLATKYVVVCFDIRHVWTESLVAVYWTTHSCVIERKVGWVANLLKWINDTLPQKKSNFNFQIFYVDPGPGSVTPGHVHQGKCSLYWDVLWLCQIGEEIWNGVFCKLLPEAL